jgi:hypothetical protein
MSKQRVTTRIVKMNSYIKPILFSTPMVKAILEGRKTQTRRGVKHGMDISKMEFAGFRYDQAYFKESGSRSWGTKCKYFIGDVLWVRETYGIAGHTTKHYVYKADIENTLDTPKGGWKPSIYMPKDACRLFLEITDMRIERLQDISEDDAIAEGVEKEIDLYLDYEQEEKIGSYYLGSAIDSVESLWAKINGQKSWDENPFVWVYTFKVVERPKS